MISTHQAAAPAVHNFIGGQRSAPPSHAEATPVHNPSTGEVIALTPRSGGREVDAAVEAAQQAFTSWSTTPVLKRAKVLFRCRQVLSEHFEELSRLICLENGKTLEEARGDVTRGIEVLEFACSIPHLLKGESLPQLAEHIDGLTTGASRWVSARASRRSISLSWRRCGCSRWLSLAATPSSSSRARRCRCRLTGWRNCFTRAACRTVF